MLPVRFDPPAAKFIKKLKDKNLKKLYQEAIDKIREDYTIGESKTGDLSGFYGYDIYYNKTNYELAYTIERINGELVVIVMAGTRENFYEQLKRYIKKLNIQLMAARYFLTAIFNYYHERKHFIYRPFLRTPSLFYHLILSLIMLNEKEEIIIQFLFSSLFSIYISDIFYLYILL